MVAANQAVPSVTVTVRCPSGVQVLVCSGGRPRDEAQISTRIGVSVGVSEDVPSGRQRRGHWAALYRNAHYPPSGHLEAPPAGSL